MLKYETADNRYPCENESKKTARGENILSGENLLGARKKRVTWALSAGTGCGRIKVTRPTIRYRTTIYPDPHRHGRTGTVL
jgi:hypothetical protein